MERDRRRRRCRSPPPTTDHYCWQETLSCRVSGPSSPQVRRRISSYSARTFGPRAVARNADWHDGVLRSLRSNLSKKSMSSASRHLAFLVLTADRIKGENNGRPVRQTQRERGGRPEDGGRGVSGGDTRGRCRNATKLGNASRLGYGPAHRGYGGAGDRRSGLVILGTGALTGRLLAPARRVLCAAGARTWAA